MISQSVYLKAILIASVLVIATLSTFTMIFTLACWDSSTHFKGLEADKDSTLGQKVYNRLYFTALTMSTTGYGDITPKSSRARACVILLLSVSMIVTLALIAISHL